MRKTKKAKRPDMQVVCRQIAHLRREKGLCTTVFAQEIEQPAWLVMLLESAHTEQSRALIDLFPDSVVNELLRKICEVYGFDNNCLITPSPLTLYPPMLENQTLPEPLLLPIIMVPEDVMTFLDELTALAMENPSILLQHDRFFLHIIRSVSRLHQLYLAQLRKNGHEALANQYQRRFSLLLDQRMKRWNMMLNLNEFDLSRAASQ